MPTTPGFRNKRVSFDSRSLLGPWAPRVTYYYFVTVFLADEMPLIHSFRQFSSSQFSYVTSRGPVSNTRSMFGFRNKRVYTYITRGETCIAGVVPTAAASYSSSVPIHRFWRLRLVPKVLIIPGLIPLQVYGQHSFVQSLSKRRSPACS
jgi:hypothetical protein